MNRRDFIKVAVPSAALATWTVNCKYEEKEHDPKGKKGEEGQTGKLWNYRVYCYERGQGEWTFSQNTKGSFAHQREYITFDEEDDLSWNPHYASGWMNDGKLHFASLDDATDFIDMHARTKDDTNLIDSIYDIYYINRDDLEYESAQPTEIQVAHFWFNGDTGRTVMWEQDKLNTNWNKVESS